MDYTEKLYRFAMEKKCSFHLYINPNTKYLNVFMFSKDNQSMDYWTQPEQGKHFTVAGKQFEDFDSAIKYYEKLLTLE